MMMSGCSRRAAGNAEEEEAEQRSQYLLDCCSYYYLVFCTSDQAVPLARQSSRLPRTSSSSSSSLPLSSSAAFVDPFADPPARPVAAPAPAPSCFTLFSALRLSASSRSFATLDRCSLSAQSRVAQRDQRRCEAELSASTTRVNEGDDGACAHCCSNTSSSVLRSASCS